VFLVDTEEGDDAWNGLDSKKPLASLEAAEDLCTADRHDTVLFVARDTANNPSEAIAWDKDFTHLFGIGCDLPGLGQRCRVVMPAATATPCITFSSTGCKVQNMQFNQEKAAGAASGVAIVTGSRNHFKNVFFMTPTATDAASYSLKLSGSENLFERCTTGQHTNPRSAASYGLWLFGAATCLRNKFIKCEFLSWSSTTDHALVKCDAEIAVVPWTIWFEDCLFDNQINGSGTLTAAIVDSSTAVNHQIIFRGRNEVAGCSAVANPLTYVLHAESGPASSKSGILMATVNES
jgi:hypothetical protein